MATSQKFRKIVLTQADIDFIWTQLRLPGNDPRRAPLGTILDPFGIRDVKGIGNNVTNPTFGAADQLFPRLTPQRWRNADGTFTFGQTGIKIVNQPTSYAVRDINLVDYSARVISNKVASQSAQSLSAIGYLTPAQQKLVVQDDPSATPGGRLSPLTLAANPLPYSSMMTLFGQFFDHGLDFVKKGKDGTILIPLLPDDPLYNDPRNAIYAPDGTTIIGYNNFIIASRTDTVHVDISISSTDTLVAALGLVQDRYTVGEPGVTTGQVTAATPIGSGIADGGVLIINNTAINIAQGSTAANVVSAINAVAQTTGVSAAIDGSNRLVLTYAAGESRNTISPFIDLSQSYGSVASHTAFVREYASFDSDGAGPGTAVTYFMTGRLVSGGIDKGIGDGAADGMATWFDIKHNASIVGVTLHDKDVLDIPEVRLGEEGVPFLDASGMWLVARHQVTGQIYYVKDSLIGANTISQVLRLNADGSTASLTNTEFSSVLPKLLLQTVGHAFLDDMAHGVLGSLNPATGDVTNPQAKVLLDSHFISGDGRTNENIGLTAIHEIFHSEHNLVLADLQAGMTYNGNGTWTETSTGRIWSGDDLFQAAKLVTEMEYQHMVFGEFARKLSPNINAFATYDITIDPGISAEFAHAVYRFGHSMLTETVAMTGVDPLTGLSTGVDKSMGLIQAFLNPTAFGDNTAAEIAIGMSNQVGNAIDEWVTDALRNNLVGLPLDLATLNIVRGRDTGIGSLNQVRADLYAQTGLPSLKPYVSWDDFGASLLHPESLENFIMAYARDTILSEYGDSNLDSPEPNKQSLAYWNNLQMGNATQRQQYADALRAAARSAMNDPKFMTGMTGLNDIDFWLGGLAEKKVDGGMLGATFDFIFARQILSLQNADRFYYLSRLAGTDLLVQIESQTFTDIIQRNTGASHLYIDIFSVPDASIEINTPDTFDGPTFSTLTAFTNNKIDVIDALGATQRVSQAGWVGSDANGWTFYGNPGDYLDARGVFSPNNTASLKGNVSEMIGGTNNAERINGLGGNDAIWADGGDDTVEGGDGNDFIRGGDGSDLLTDKQGDDFLWGEAGNDVIRGGAGIDQVFGGEGNDQLYGGLGDDAINGELGNDVIFGDNGSIERQLVNGVWIEVMDRDGGADVILAGLGNDIIYGGGGIDIIDAGEGDDMIVGGLGGDLMTGWFGNDIFLMDASDIGFLNTLDGGMDHDIADYSASAGTGVGTGTNRLGITIDLNPIAPVLAPIGAPPLPDFFLSVEEVIGSNYNDKIRGGGSVPLNLGLIIDELGGPVNFGTVAFPLFRTYTVKIDGGLGNDTIEGGDGTGQWLRQLNGSYAYVGWALDANGITYTYVDPSGNLPWDPTAEGPGMDVLIGGLGIDTVSYASAASTAQPAPGALVGPTPNLTGVTINLGTTNAQNTVNAGWDMLVGFENVIGSAFADTITGDAGANVLDGGAGNDTLSAGGGNDTFIGGLGDDSIAGGAGVNTVSYVTSNSTASVGATPGQTGVAVDLSNAAAQNTVNAGLDTLSGIQNAIGSLFDDTLSGGADAVNVANLLDGGDGADSLRGGGGNDTLIGGLGNDTIDGGAGTADTVSYAGTTGAVAVNLSATAITTALGSVAANRSAGSAGVDVLSNLENVVGGDGNDTIAGSAANNLLDGGAGDDSIDGAAGNDTVIGGLGNDTLLGGTGNDLLQGGFGNDRLSDGSGQNTMAGGAGNDLYLVAADNGTNRDLVVELADEGLDTVELAAGVTTYTLTANVENLTYTGSVNSTGSGFTGNALGNLIRAGAGNQSLSGAAGNDTLEGGQGDDTLNGGADIDTASYASNTLAVSVDLTAGTATSSTAVGGSGTDRLQSIENVIGGSGNDSIWGSTADNTIDGGIGADTMIGGTGNDTYVVDDLADVIIEDSLAGGGTDTVITSLATYTLAANVENVRMISGGVPQVGIAAASPSSMSVTGNTLDNLIVGSTGNDSLLGMDGNDTIDGGEGADTMVGGKGDDVYIVDNAADVIVEVSGEGNDTVRTSLSTFSLANNLENLTYIGPIGFYGVGNGGNNTLSGGAGNDTLVGGFGDDVLIGGDGNDTASYADATGSVIIDLSLQVVYGYYGNDTLISIERIIAGKGNDRLIGTAGNDTLDGGIGGDTMIGGLGDDVYIFDDSSDFVVEGLNAGVDTILTNSGYVVLSADLDNVENVRYTGLLSFEAHGNSFANRIEGGSQNDKIYGEYGNDTLVGGGGNDSLFGGVGNDYLLDGLGFNQLAGGEDNDTYRIDIAAADQILELAGQGVDTVETTLLNYTLGSNVENLRYVGVAGLIGFNGTGNELDNQIEGGDGADNLYGLAGNDTLIGGIGNDVLDGGDGRDATSYATASSAVTVNLATGINSLSGGGGIDTLYSIEDLIGSAFADSLTGDAADNVIEGGGGNDTLNGGAGTDTAAYLSATSRVVVSLTPAFLTNYGSSSGGAGTDRLFNFENLTGSNFSDSLTGSTGANVLDGSYGNDSLDGGSGNDTLIGGAGTDTLIGGAGDDRLDGGFGIDTANYSAISSAVTVDLRTGLASGGAGTDTLVNIENVLGGSGNDTLVSGSGDNTLNGATGTDTVSFEGTTTDVAVNLAAGTASGGAGRDTLISIENVTGGSGADTIVGSSAANVLNGGAGNDLLDGGAGSDTLIGGTGNDTLIGGADTDFVSYAAASAAVTVNLLSTSGGNATDEGNDTLQGIENVIGSAFNDVITGGADANVLFGVDGNDSLDGGAGSDTLIGGAGNDQLVGGADIDTVSYAAASAAVIVNLSSFSGGNTVSGGEGADTLSGIENVIGSGSADQITGDASANLLDGGGGNDTLSGGAGNDTLIGGAGNDSILGGAGTDTVSYASSTATVTVNLQAGTASGAAGNDTLSGADIENVIGGSGNDTITGRSGVNNSFAGGAGNDTYVIQDLGDVVVENANEGTDTVSLSGIASYTISANVENLINTGSTAFSGVGSTANNTMTGGTGADTLSGLAGNDSLSGGDGADSLSGGDGDDTIIGGAGNDTLLGGNGTDTLSYAGTTAAVTVNLAVGTATGGAGTDSLSGFENVLGGSGADTLIGSLGDNTITGGAGADSMIGGAGNDTYYVDNVGDVIVENAGEGIDTVYTSSTTYTIGANVENVVLTSGVLNGLLGTANALTGIGNSLDNYISGGAGADSLDGGAGNDTLVSGGAVLVANVGPADTLNGGTGTDTASFLLDSAAVTITLANQTSAQNTGNSNVRLVSIENLTGSIFDDSLTGDLNANLINGADGNDTIIGGDGNDTLQGGAGIDTVSYAGNAVAVTVNLSASQAGGAGTDTLIGFENITGSGNGDTLTGDTGANLISAGAGDDILNETTGNDTLDGGAGADRAAFSGRMAEYSFIQDPGTRNIIVRGGTRTVVNPNDPASDTYSIYSMLVGIETVYFSAENLSVAIGQLPLSDITPPTVLSFTSTASNGFYKQDGTIEIVATLSEAVRAGSTLRVMLDSKADPSLPSSWVELQAAVVGNILRGTYTVAAGDFSEDLTVVAYDGTNVNDVVGNNRMVATDLPPINIADGSAIVVDTEKPDVIGFGSTSANGSYGLGDVITINARMSEIVRIGSSITVTLNNDTHSQVTLTTPVDGTSLRGLYTIKAGDDVTQLAVAEYTIGAVDLAGNTNTVLDPVPPFDPTKLINFDTTAPAAPVVTSVEMLPSAGSVSVQSTVAPIMVTSGPIYTNDRKPIVHIEAEADATVYVYNGTRYLGQAVAVSPGSTHYTFQPQFSLAQGSYNFTAKAMDVAGNMGSASPLDAMVMILDFTPPPKPTVDSQITFITTPILEGTVLLAAGDVFTVSVAHNSYTVTVGSDGVTVTGDVDVLSVDLALNQWALTALSSLPDGLPDGTYPVQASVTDRAGNVSIDATTNELVVNNVPPVLKSFSTTTPSSVYTVGMPIDIIATFSEPLKAGSQLLVQLNVSTVNSDDGYRWILLETPTLDQNSNILVATYIVGADETSVNPLDPTLSAPIRVTGYLLSEFNGITVTQPAANLAGVEMASVDVTDPDQVNNFTGLIGGNIRIDTTAPATPLITLITDDVAPNTGAVLSYTNDTKPSFSITADAGSLVRFYAELVDTNSPIPLGTATEDPSNPGSFSFTPLNPITNGSYRFFVTASDTAGNTTQSPFFSVGSNTIFTIDTVAPTAPVIDPLITNDTTPTITGSVLLLNGVTVADRESLAVVVNDVRYTEDSGLVLTGLTGYNDSTSSNYQRYTWSLQLPELPVNTTYEVSATVTDKAGNATSDTSTNELRIDTTPPTIVAFSSSTTNGSYKAGSTINITATASESLRANSTIEVILNTGIPGDTVILTALTDGTTLTGSYQVGAGDTSADLDVTSFTVVDAKDLAGNTLLTTLPTGLNSLAGRPGAIVVDTTVPDAPVINTITDNVATPATVTTAGATDDSTPAFNITAERGGYVSLYLVNPAGDSYLGSATVAPATGLNGTTGSVTITPTALPDGVHTFYATVRDVAGNISPASGPFVLAIDNTAPIAPTLTTPGTIAGTNPVLTGTASLSVRDVLTVTLTSTNPAFNQTFTYDILNPPAKGWSFSGNAWTLSLADLAVPVTLQSGTYTVAARVNDSMARQASATSASVLADYSPPTITAFGSPTAAGPYGVGSTINLTATASESLKAGSTITVTLNSGVSVELMARQNGTSLTGAYVIGEGDINISPLRITSFSAGGTSPGAIRPTDLIGNVIQNVTMPGTSFTQVFSIDTVPPGSPTITSASDNVAQFIGALVSGALTNDATPTLTIAAEAGTTVRLWSNGVQIAGTATQTTPGTWTFTPTTALPDGIQSLVARAYDAAGNASGDSNTFELLIDSTPPTAPTVTPLTTSSLTPTISGTATIENGDTLAVTVGGVTYTTANGLVLTQVLDTSFTWSLTLTTALPATSGAYPVTATVTDLAGNFTSDATTGEITLDRTPPSISAFNSGSPNGTYREGQTITITATADEAVVAGSQITATLDTGDTVLLTAVSNGTLFSGTYTVSLGDVSADLNVVSYVPGNAGLNPPQDLYGNTMTLGASAGFTTLAANSALVVNGTSTVSFAQAAVAVTEGNAGTTTMTFTVTLDRALSVATTVNWAFVSDGPTPATAADFVGGLPAGGTVTIAANTTSQTFTVAVAGDTLREANETFQVRLSNPSANLTIGGTAIATGTITNNDGFTDSTGNGGGATNRTVTASDYIVGGTVNNNFNASTSTGSVVLDGGAGNDTLIGGTAADQLLGRDGLDSLSGGNGNDVITGGTGFDRMTGGGNNDTFYFAAGDAAANTSTTTSRDFITDFTKALDIIDYGAPLRVGGVATGATANQASINLTTGVATFAANSGTSLTDALADVAVSFGADGAQTAGEFALFRVNGAGNYWMMISDGVAGVGANDVAVELGGITTVGSISINSYGQFSILT